MNARLSPALFFVGVHCLSHCQAGTVSAFGGNHYGSLGDGTNVNRFSPVTMSGLTGIEAIAAGAYHSMALDASGTVWTCGLNNAGQLGDDSYTERWIAVPSAMHQAVAFAGGHQFSLALRGDGTVFAWGANDYHQLGRPSGDVWNSKLPLQVPQLSGIVAIAAGSNYGMALDRRGHIWTWGGNTQGQLGDGTNISRPNPRVVGPDRVVAISAGEEHSLALTAGGKVWAWGNNGNGRLGDGTTTPRWSPVSVVGLADAVGVCAMSGTSMAVLRDRTVVGWGSDYNSELAGQGHQTTPTAIPYLGDVIDLKSGWYHGVARCGDGTIWTWGDNFYGALGRTFDHAVPTPVAGLSGVGYVAGGRYHTLALHRPVTGVTGTVGLDGYVGPCGLRVAIEPVGQSVPVQLRLCGTTNSGEYSVSFGSVGQFNAVFSANHHLSRRYGPLTFDGSPLTLPSIALINGDVTGDNTINIQDFLAFRQAFGSSGGGDTWDSNADLNGDAAVNIADFIVLRRNFGKNGD